MSGNPFAADRLTVSAVYKGFGARAKAASVTEKTVHGVSLVLHDDTKRHSDVGHGDGTWIYSFADLIMNLLMFFVMMFAISSIDKNKFSQVQEAFSSFNKNKETHKAREATQPSGEGPGSGQGFSPYSGEVRFSNKMTNTEILERVRDLLARVDEKQLNLNSKNKEALKEMKPQVAKLARDVDASLKADPMLNAFEVVVASRKIFEGDAISKEGQKILARLAKELFGVRGRLSVNVASFVSKRSLSAKKVSAERAASVATELLEALDLDEAKVTAAGFALTPKDKLTESERVVIRLSLAPKPEVKE